MRIDETTLPIGAPQVQTQTEQPARTSTLWLFVRMVFVLALVIAAIYGIAAILRRGMNPPQKTDPYLKSVASVSLGAGKSLQVITVGDKAFVVGVSENAVNLVGELDDKELIDSMNLHADREPSASPRDFASIFSRFLPPKAGSGQRKEADITSYFSAAGETQDYLRRRREGLRSDETQGAEEYDETPRG